MIIIEVKDDNDVDEDEVFNDDNNNNVNIDRVANGTNQATENNEDAKESVDQFTSAISVWNSADELVQPYQTTEEEVCRRRSGRISKPHDFSSHFL